MSAYMILDLDSSVNHKAIIKTSGNNLPVMPHHRTAQAQVRFDVAKSNMAAVDPRWLPPARQMYHPASVELLKSKLDVKMHQNVRIVEKYTVCEKNATSISIYKGFMYITKIVPACTNIFTNLHESSSEELAIQ